MKRRKKLVDRFQLYVFTVIFVKETVRSKKSKFPLKTKMKKKKNNRNSYHSSVSFGCCCCFCCCFCWYLKICNIIKLIRIEESTPSTMIKQIIVVLNINKYVNFDLTSGFRLITRNDSLNSK